MDTLENLLITMLLLLAAVLGLGGFSSRVNQGLAYIGNNINIPANTPFVPVVPGVN